MTEPGGRSSAGVASHDHSPTGSKQPSFSSAKSSGKCPQTHFLMFALTVGQVVVIMMFLVWTIKAFFIRYNRVFIVTPIDPIAIDSRHPTRNVSNQDNITYHHSNYRNITAHLLAKAIQLDWQEIVMTNESRQMPNTKVAKRKLRIVGTTDTQLLPLTLNWLESLKRLKLDYDVTLIAEDDRAYDILSGRIKDSRNIEKTRLIAARRSEGTRVSGLSLTVWDVILDILESGTDVVHIAVDSVWLKDPVPLIWQKYDQCEVWITRGTIQTRQSLSFALLKSSPNVISYVIALKEHLTNSTDGVLTDAMVLRLEAKLLHFNVTLCNLGENEFPTEQHVFEEEGWFNDHKEGIFVVRADAIVDTAQKRYLLQKRSLWYI